MNRPTAEKMIAASAFFLLAALSLAGCRSAPSGLYTSANPARLAYAVKCSTGGTTPTVIAAGALLSSLETLGWEIETIYSGLARVDATACLGASRGAECVTMAFSIRQDGRISGTASPATPIKNKMDGHVIRWMRNLDKELSHRTCMTRDELAWVLGHYNITL